MYKLETWVFFMAVRRPDDLFKIIEKACNEHVKVFLCNVDVTRIRI